MSWKFVFNSSVGDKYWSGIEFAQEAAKKSGYMFFTWNGQVLFIDQTFTGIEVKDLF